MLARNERHKESYSCTIRNDTSTLFFVEAYVLYKLSLAMGNDFTVIKVIPLSLSAEIFFQSYDMKLPERFNRCKMQSKFLKQHTGFLRAGTSIKYILAPILFCFHTLFLQALQMRKQVRKKAVFRS